MDFSSYGWQPASDLQALENDKLIELNTSFYNFTADLILGAKCPKFVSNCISVMGNIKVKLRNYSPYTIASFFKKSHSI